mgnify:CR=1 FL=1
MASPAGTVLGTRRDVTSQLVLSTLVFVMIPLAFLMLMELVKSLGRVPDYKLPHVWDIASYLTKPNYEGEPAGLYLLDGMRTTAVEALIGLGFAVVAGVVLGTLVVYLPRVGRGVLPLIVGVQNLPIIALAPPLLVWIGTDWKSKSIIAAYVAFFPMVVFTVRGLSSARPQLLALMRSYAAGPWQTFHTVRFPVAVPYLFSGLRAAAALSVVGAIVAELPVGSNTGIGQIIYNAAAFYNFDPAALWASTVAAFGLGAGFFLAVVLLEWLVSLAVGNRAQT